MLKQKKIRILSDKCRPHVTKTLKCNLTPPNIPTNGFSQICNQSNNSLCCLLPQWNKIRNSKRVVSEKMAKKPDLLINLQIKIFFPNSSCITLFLTLVSSFMQNFRINLSVVSLIDQQLRGIGLIYTITILDKINLSQFSYYNVSSNFRLCC